MTVNVSTVYRTIENDVLDAIVTRHYGEVRGALGAVLAANPQLRKLPAVLPSGVTLTLPVFTPEPIDGRVRLWS